MRRLLSLTAVAAVAISTAVTVAPPAGAAGRSAAARAADSISWSECLDPFLTSLGIECATVDVPVDYAHPGGTKIQLAVSRLKHTVPDEQYQGVVLVNPGGPGGSGLSLSFLGLLIPHGVGASYDWIGFDPRGVGDSVPALSCDPNYFAPNRPDYTPSTPQIESAWLARAQGYAEDCANSDAANVGLLDHVKTTDSARDMDSIRAALGAEQINYYGFSYGTYLGQTYATMFPSRVRRMVMDGNIDPRKVFYESNLAQDVAFETAAQLWFDWIARHDDAYHLGTTAAAVQAKYYAQLDALRAQPLVGFGPAEWTDAFLYAGYAQSIWPPLAEAFAAMVNDGDPSQAIQWYQITDGPGDDNLFAMYSAVECTDAPWPSNWNRWEADNWRINRDHPFFTWGNAWFNAQCAFWPAEAQQRFHVHPTGAPPVLLVNETLDAATPYSGALEARKLFGDSALIAVVGGTSHANSLAGNACVDDRIAAYLADGTLPARQPGNHADVECAPLPEPVPADAAAAVAAGSGSSRTALARSLLASVRMQTARVAG